jgi:hypothetical protein
MSLLSNPEIFRRVLVTRDQHAEIVFGSEDTEAGSRIGGPPPACLENALPTCAVCTKPMVYYLTLAPDILPASSALSVFYCQDFGCFARARELVEPASLVVRAHQDCSRSTTGLSARIAPRRLLLGAITPDLNEYGAPAQASKVGGLPGFIQPSGKAYARALSEQSLEFLFQFDEESYPPRTADKYVFGGGAMYVFTPFDRQQLLLAQSKVFWQST